MISGERFRGLGWWVIWAGIAITDGRRSLSRWASADNALCARRISNDCHPEDGPNSSGIRHLTMRVWDMTQVREHHRRWSHMVSSALRSVREYGPVWGSWDGGECLHLEHWAGSHWDRIAYSTFDDASEGVWGPPRGGEQFCHPVGVSGTLSLPVEAVPGNYRVCNIGGSTDCLQFAFDPSD